MMDLERRYGRLIVSYLDPILVSSAIAVAIFFLFHKIGTVPPLYPWSDESAIAADAVETLTKGPQMVYPAQLAGGSLAVYLEAGFMALFNRSLLGLRVLNALLNVSLVALTYALSRVMFASQGKLFSQLIAGLSALWLASSVWLLALGRIAVPNFALMPPMTVGCFYLLWRGLETGQRWCFVLSGLMLGLSFHGYVPALFLPVALMVFFLTEDLISKLNRRPSLFKVYWRQLLALVTVATIVALPLLLYLIASPEVFLRRPMQVAMVSQSFTSQRLFQSLVSTLSSFGLSSQQLLRGQRDVRVFDPLTALWFLIGIAVAVAHVKRPVQLFLLIWWATLILPAVLSSASVGFDLMRRAGGVETVTFIFPALGLVTVGQWLWERRPRLISAAGPAVAVALIAFSGITSYQFYFVNWATRPDIPRLFAEEPVRFAEWLTAEATSDTVYVFPVRRGVSPTTRPELFTVRYLYNGQAATAYPDFDEATLPEALTDLSAGKSTLKLMLPDRMDIDPKGYLDFLLEQHATRTSYQTLFGYTIKTYGLKSDSEKFSTSNSVVATNVDFGQAMRLVDYLASYPTLPAGETLWLALRWTKLLDTGQDYNVGLSLVDERSYPVAQANMPLLSRGLHKTTSHWAIGEMATGYYALSIPAYTLPGDYTLQVVVYNTAGERLVPNGGQIDLSLPLMRVTVMPAALPIDPPSPSVATPVEIPVTADLHVIGIDLSQPTIAHPGDEVRISLTWQATEAPQRDYDLIISLIGEEGLAYATAPHPLASASYPTTEWRRGEILQAHYTLLLPPGLASGDYTLAMRLLDSATDSIVSDKMLQSLMIEARPHDFTVPNPSHILNVGFGTAVRLVGYDQPIISQTGQVTAQIYWQALAEMPESYKIFAHIVDSTGIIIAQSDSIPGNGTAPTTSWVTGEIITDTIQVSLPGTALNKTYRLIIGLYSSVDGVRLPVVNGSDGEDSLVLSEIILAE